MEVRFSWLYIMVTGHESLLVVASLVMRYKGFLQGYQKNNLAAIHAFDQKNILASLVMKDVGKKTKTRLPVNPPEPNGF